jgi:SAM-dependent methyltransferase
VSARPISAAGSEPRTDTPQWLAAFDAQVAGAPVAAAQAAASGGLGGWLLEQAAGRALYMTDRHAGSGESAPAGAGNATVTVAAPAGPLPDGPFDTVLLDEVLETVADPGALLTAVARVLGPGGTLALTARFGVAAGDPAARRVLYPASLVGLVDPFFEVLSVTVADGRMRLCATSDPQRLQAPSSSRRRATSGRSADEAVLARLGATLPAVEEALHAAELDVMRLASQRERERLRRQDAECAAATAEQAVAGLQAEAARLEEQRATLEQEREHLRAALAEEQAKRRRMRQRRWWRLGEVLAAGRDPRHWPRLPIAVVRVITGRGPNR